MHEIHIIKNIIAVITEKAKENNISKVTKINVTLGRLSGISKENFIYWFKELSKDTPADGSKISFKETMDPNVFLESIEA